MRLRVVVGSVFVFAGATVLVTLAVCLLIVALHGRDAYPYIGRPPGRIGPLLAAASLPLLLLGAQFLIEAGRQRLEAAARWIVTLLPLAVAAALLGREVFRGLEMASRGM